MLWHEHARRSLKVLLVGGLHYSGVLSAVRRHYKSNRAVILMYHRVTPVGEGVPDYSPNGMVVTPAEFAMQMGFIRRHYDVVPLSKVVGAVGGEGNFPPGMCAVTFDDGWRDVYEYAFPILRDCSIPATVFVTTGYVSGSAWSWQERARYLMAVVFNARDSLKSRSDGGDGRERLRAAGLEGLLALRPGQFRGFVLETLRGLEMQEDRHCRLAVRALEDVSAQVIQGPARPFLNWNEVKEMAAAGIEFGNHTVSHAVLPKLVDRQVVEEISNAGDKVCSEVDCSERYLAYPYGKHDRRVMDLARGLGVRAACTTKIGHVRAGDDLMALNRVNISSEVACNEVLFAGRLLCW